MIIGDYSREHPKISTKPHVYMMFTIFSPIKLYKTSIDSRFSHHFPIDFPNLPRLRFLFDAQRVPRQLRPGQRWRWRHRHNGTAKPVSGATGAPGAADAVARPRYGDVMGNADIMRRLKRV